jgi:hypothetical protein
LDCSTPTIGIGSKELRWVDREVIGGSNGTDVKAMEAELRDSLRAVREARVKALTGRQRPKDEPPLCSFCGAGRNNVRALIPNFAADPSAHICDECIQALHHALKAI